MYLKDVFEAVKCGDVLELQRMVQQGSDINAVDKKFQYTVLHWASHHGAIECLHWLLWHGIDIHKQTKEGWTPAHIAAIKGRTNCLQALAANGVDMNIQDNKGKTVAHLAVAHGHAQTLQEILRKGADLDIKDKLGWNVFHTASFHGRLGCLQLLMKWDKSKFNDLDLDGNTPVHLAASEGHLSCLKFAIASTDDGHRLLKACNDHGETPKDLALQFFKKNCVAYLEGVQYDLDNPERADNLSFPAHNSAYNGDIEYLQMVIETGVATIDERDERGSTPTHKAAGNGQVEILKWLIEKGANINLMNTNGETPRDVAARFGQVSCLKILGGESDADDADDGEYGENDVIPDEPQLQAEAKGRAQKKIETLAEQLEIAKLNFQQLGGVLEEDKRKIKQESEQLRINRELEKTLEYERIRREKLEADMDKLRLQLHRVHLELEHEREKLQYYQGLAQQKNQINNTGTTTQQKTKKKKKKGAARVRPTSGITIQRPAIDYTPKPPNNNTQQRLSSAHPGRTSMIQPTPPLRPKTASRYRSDTPNEKQSDHDEDTTEDISRNAGDDDIEENIIEVVDDSEDNDEDDTGFKLDLDSVVSKESSVVSPSKEITQHSSRSSSSSNSKMSDY